MILGFNIFNIFILLTLIYAKFYTNFSLNLTYYITQPKCFLLCFFNCFYFCQVYKIALVINHSTSTFKCFALIFLFCIKSLQLLRFKAKCYRWFITLEFCELIREKCDEFLSFILHALFYTVILIYFSSHVVFSLNLKLFSQHIFSYIYAFFNHKVLTFLSFLTFLFAIFNNSPYKYINK